ncbi:MAG: RNA methyltransferase [Ruminococcaceae bacterium]|nr:RNA methyltransferase [Oscillospiraceae bacterium]
MLNTKEVVTSRQNPTVKFVCSLSDKKARREARAFRFDGIKLFLEAVACRTDITHVIVSDGADGKITDAVRSAVAEGVLRESAVSIVSQQLFERISEERSPEGIITVAKWLDAIHTSYSAIDRYSVGEGESLLVAEALRDPGNLGTVIRSCAALGIDRLIISDDCADIYNPKTIRAAMGGLFRLKIDVVRTELLPDTVALLRKNGRRVFAAALHKDAETVGELEMRAGDCFVVGNEGHGLSDRVIDACDACAIIPMTENSESLNAAAAAAICIWETVKAKET